MLEELLDIFEPVVVDASTEKIDVFPGAVYIIRDINLKSQLWARGFCGPFEVGEWDIPTPEEPPEVHVFFATPAGNIRFRAEGGFVDESVTISATDGSDVEVLGGTPFGADPREEPVIVCGALIAEPGPSGDKFVAKRYATSGVSWRQLKLLEASSVDEMPDLRDLWEAAGFFLDPVRAASFVLNSRGHSFFVDDVGTGKSKLIEALSVAHTAGRGATEAAMTWNARDQTPGVVLREPGGFVGWDEIDKADPSEVQKFLMDLLNFKVVRKAAGFLNEVQHYCRFLIAGNRVPSFSEGTLHAFLSRMQYVGGVGGDAREEIAFDISQEAVDELSETVAKDFVPVHVAEYVDDYEEFSEVSNEVYKELASKYRKKIGRALERALLRVTKRFPPESGPVPQDPGELLEALMNSGADVEINDEFIKSCAWGHLHDKLRRFSDTLAAFGVDECAELAREAFSYTDLDNPSEDDIEACVEAWVVSLDNNYAEMCVGDDTKIPLPKVGYTPIWTVDDLKLKWDDIDLE